MGPPTLNDTQVIGTIYRFRNAAFEEQRAALSAENFAYQNHLWRDSLNLWCQQLRSLNF